VWDLRYFLSCHWLKVFLPRACYYGAAPSYIHSSTGSTFLLLILGILIFCLGTSFSTCHCMTSIPVDTWISKLKHWRSLLTSVRSSLQPQVSLLDSALSNLTFSQPSPPVIQNIQSEVLREISDLELTKNLLITTQPSTGDSYKHIFRLSDRRNSLRHRAAYYQELSKLFDSIYNYLYQNWFFSTLLTTTVWLIVSHLKKVIR